MGEDTGIWLRGENPSPPPAADPPWPPEVGANQAGSRRTSVGDRYKIDALLAETPASFVYKARDVWQQDMDVVIKEMRRPADCDQEEWKELLIRFEKSASIGHHPSIVEILNYQIRDDVPFLVMEYVPGGDLHDRLYGRKDPAGKQTQPPPMTLVEIRAVMDSLFAALEFTHSRKIVHRDIKPANILHGGGNQWKLTDFGIARFRSSVHTQHRAFIGTPAYSSPEQVIGDAVDGRTDIYSCGIVLYEMLAGQRPFRGSSETVRRLILEGKPLAPSLARMQMAYPGDPAITDSLDRVVAQAMAVDREQRYQTVQQFRDAWNKALADRGKSAPEPPPSASSSRQEPGGFRAVETIVAGDRLWDVSRPAPGRPAGGGTRPPRPGRLRWVLGAVALTVLAAGTLAAGYLLYREKAVLPFPKVAPTTSSTPAATTPQNAPGTTATPNTDAADPSSRSKVIFPYVKPYEAPPSPDSGTTPAPIESRPEIRPEVPNPGDGDKGPASAWPLPNAAPPPVPVPQQPAPQPLVPPQPLPQSPVSRPPPIDGGTDTGSRPARPQAPAWDGDSIGHRTPSPAPSRPGRITDPVPGSSRPGSAGHQTGSPSAGSISPGASPGRPRPGPGPLASPPDAAPPSPAGDDHFLALVPREPAPPSASGEARPTSTARETGMTCKVLTPEEAASRNITGVTAPLMLVDGVWSGSAGSMAGIERFDIVQRKGGLWLRENGQTYGGCVAYPAAGSNTLSVEVWRNGRWQAKTLRWP